MQLAGYNEHYDQHSILALKNNFMSKLCEYRKVHFVATYKNIRKAIHSYMNVLKIEF